MNTILPIGSVVMLNNATKPVMIFGYLQKSNFTKDEVVDYVGVPMTDIAKVLFEGYRSEDFKPWEELLALASARHLAKEKT